MTRFITQINKVNLAHEVATNLINAWIKNEHVSANEPSPHKFEVSDLSDIKTNTDFDRSKDTIHLAKSPPKHEQIIPILQNQQHFINPNKVPLALRRSGSKHLTVKEKIMDEIRKESPEPFQRTRNFGQEVLPKHSAETVQHSPIKVYSKKSEQPRVEKMKL